ncbi:hypothetical protein [Streptomyces sp. NPDC101150]|uniref:hypothetical protein n=1 Tax=Streptomyces sp. NPDC101150 TaxID=3366114 RepID=UPI00382F2B43
MRDNLNATMTGTAAAAGDWFVSSAANTIVRRIPTAANVTTAQTTTSTSYTNLTTTGPAVTITTGTSALVMFGAAMSSNTTDAACFMSVDVSSATTIAANDDWGTWMDGVPASNTVHMGMAKLFTNLTAGSNVFTAKYRTSTGTATFSNRHLMVIPF